MPNADNDFLTSLVRDGMLCLAGAQHYTQLDAAKRRGRTGRPVPDENDDFTEGKKAGGEWLTWAEKHPLRNAIDPAAPSKPHRDGNDDFNEGVDEGIKERKNRR